MMVEKGVIPTTHESIKATKKEIVGWKEKVGKSGVCPAELKSALKRVEKRGRAVTNTVGQGGQKIFVEKYMSGILTYAILTEYMIFKKDPTEVECRLAEEMGQKAAIKKLEQDRKGASEGGKSSSKQTEDEEGESESASEETELEESDPTGSGSTAAEFDDISEADQSSGSKSSDINKSPPKRKRKVPPAVVRTRKVKAKRLARERRRLKEKEKEKKHKKAKAKENCSAK